MAQSDGSSYSKEPSLYESLLDKGPVVQGCVATPSVQDVVRCADRDDRILCRKGENHRNELCRTLAANINAGIQRLSEKHRGLYVLRDIVSATKYEEGLRMAESLRRIDAIGIKGRKASERFAAIIWHPEEGENGHYHIYHTCAYNQSHCTCAFLRGFKLKRRLPRFANNASRFKEDDWLSWLEYFLSSPREIIHLQIGGISLIRDVHQLVVQFDAIRSEEQIADRTMESNGISRQDSW